MNLPLLQIELSKPEYQTLSDADAAALLDATTSTPISRFGSLRTLASLLTPDEYNALRAALDQAAQSSVLISDMSKMLAMPGDDQGNGGGFDFGASAFQAMLDQLCPPETAAKVKAYAQRTVTKAQQLGLGIRQVSAAMVGFIRSNTALNA